jgi:type VI secretion system protein ImpM
MMFRSLRPPPSQRPVPIELGGVALGKFAGYPEFLRPSDGGEALDRLDAWMDEGTQVALERWGAEWNTAFLMGAAYGFLWQARPDDAHLCGIIAPSRDAVGRDYPLAVATRFSPALVARAPHIVPLAFGDFLDEAYRAVDEARSTPISVADFTARVQAIASATEDDVLRAEAEYSEWAYGTRLEEGWGAIFVGERPLDQAVRALEVIGASLVPVREHRSLEVPLVLRLPLGTGGVAAAALWFDVVRRICRWSSTIPSAFWAVDNQALLLPIGNVPGTVPARTLSELWRPSAGGGFLCDGSDSAPWSMRSRGLFDPGQILREIGGEAPMAAFLDALVR